MNETLRRGQAEARVWYFITNTYQVWDFNVDAVVEGMRNDRGLAYFHEEFRPDLAALNYFVKAGILAEKSGALDDKYGDPVEDIPTLVHAIVKFQNKYIAPTSEKMAVGFDSLALVLAKAEFTRARDIASANYVDEALEHSKRATTLLNFFKELSR